MLVCPTTNEKMSIWDDDFDVWDPVESPPVMPTTKKEEHHDLKRKIEVKEEVKDEKDIKCSPPKKRSRIVRNEKQTIVNQIRQEDVDLYERLLDNSWRYPAEITIERQNEPYVVSIRSRPDAYRFATTTENLNYAGMDSHARYRVSCPEPTAADYSNTAWPFYHEGITEQRYYWRRSDVVRDDHLLARGSFPRNMIPKVEMTHVIYGKMVQPVSDEKKPLQPLIDDEDMVKRQKVENDTKEDFDTSKNPSEEICIAIEGLSAIGQRNYDIYQDICSRLDNPHFLEIGTESSLEELKVEYGNVYTIENIFTCAVVERVCTYREHDDRATLFRILITLVDQCKPYVNEMSDDEKTTIYALRAFARVFSMMPTDSLIFLKLFKTMLVDERSFLERCSDAKVIRDFLHQRAVMSTIIHPEFGFNAIYYDLINCILAHVGPSGLRGTMKRAGSDTLRKRYKHNAIFNNLLARFYWSRDGICEDKQLCAMVIEFTVDAMEANSGAILSDWQLENILDIPDIDELHSLSIRGELALRNKMAIEDAG
ncbi:hypothetical protein QR680_006949 [Steinernema hermaphroditum]|uniref:Uncharacterized protein n=1 Tax=Steinernema hermaphroditum TaxID=289476 RepID=A0AA39LXY4_9BILA|nr:hypothetical protein QR680_006949 [Steinernema hermaphroditum]